MKKQKRLFEVEMASSTSYACVVNVRAFSPGQALKQACLRFPELSPTGIVHESDSRTVCRLKDLKAGQFALVSDGKMAVLCLSNGSFSPLYEEFALVVNIASGIGAFQKDEECEVVGSETAFRVASTELRSDDCFRIGT